MEDLQLIQTSNDCIVISANLKNVITSRRFAGNSFLRTAIIDSSIKKIETSAFEDSKNLSKIIIKDDIHIEDKAFRACNKLKTAQLDDSIKVISDNMFADCHALENINLPKNLVSI